MMEKQGIYELAELIYKSISKTISIEEKKVLDTWLSNKDNKKLYLQIINKEAVLHKMAIYRRLNKEAVFQKVQNRITIIEKKNRKVVVFNVLKYAAVFTGILFLAFYYQNNIATGQLEYTPLVIEDEIITLTLNDGTVKMIDGPVYKEIVNSKGDVVGQQKGNQLDYIGQNEVEELVYNELYVPYGKRYQVVLSDSTLVHLNSGSSLRYPVRFLKGNSREVELIGEGYFDVAKDATRPFIVNANEINIRVLGTQFNVSSYANEEEVNTVLVEGSVGLYLKNKKYSEERCSFLKAGQIGILDKKGKSISINTVDTSLHTSWIEGKLIFRNTPFEIIRKRLERHYNVIIINNNKALDKNTYKAVFDIESIEQVLETLNRNYAIEYLIVNNQIIIN